MGRLFSIYIRPLGFCPEFRNWSLVSILKSSRTGDVVTVSSISARGSEVLASMETGWPKTALLLSIRCDIP